jgi:hypothetical protein
MIATRQFRFFSSFSLYKNSEIKMHKIIILLVDLYRYETWSHTLREDQTLRMSESMVPRRIFGPKRKEVGGGLRKPQNEGLRNLHNLPYTILVIRSRRIRWEGHVARMGEMKYIQNFGRRI